MAHIEDINVEERVANGKHKITATDTQYASYINQFCSFMHSEERYIPSQKMISADLLTDRNIAAFFIHLGDANEYKPHFLKSAR